MEAIDFSSGAFRKELHAILKNPPKHSVVWNITPQMAEDIIAICNKNARNRPLRKGVIRRYAKSMAAGEWMLTRVPIIFSRNHALLDGQHRLEACIQSGADFQSTVEFNAPDTAFATVDTGARRTTPDIFAIKGEQYSMILNGAIGFVWRYEHGILHGKVGKNPHVMPDPLGMWEYLNTQHGGLRDAVRHTFDFKKNGFKAQHHLYAALCHLCAMKDPAGAFKFFEQAATGQHHFEWKPQNPLRQLRRFLMEDEIARGRQENASEVRKAAYIVQAWNAWRSGSSIASFKWRTLDNPMEEFPEIK